MSGAAGYRVSIGGLVFYLILAAVFLATGDRDHAIMFTVGSILWIGSAFVWARVRSQGD